ncbi:MAG: DUF2505 domain-containing protein [Actinobacteria bacterium]|nr:DUF2505 domain-containing protein [Actinomycetota bacterium]
MRFQILQDFAGPLDQVEDALVDPAFLERLGGLPKLGQPELVNQVVEGPMVHQEVRYRFAGELGAAVRKVVDPQRLSWVEKSALDRRTHRTTWHIVADHYKHLLRCSGTFEMHEVDGRTRRTTDGDIKVNVPFVGGKVEAAIVAGLREHAQMEEQVMAAWLERR